MNKHRQDSLVKAGGGKSGRRRDLCAQAEKEIKLAPSGEKKPRSAGVAGRPQTQSSGQQKGGLCRYKSARFHGTVAKRGHRAEQADKQTYI